MVLQDLFDTLASGEFSNLALGQGVTGSIKEDAYPKVVSAINRSLLSLYQKFLLKKKRVYLVQQNGITRYYLRTKYLGYSGATGPEAYLVDYPNEVFLDDVIRILWITDIDGNPIELNPPHPVLEQTYFRSAQFDALDLITSLDDQTFIIEFQAKLPLIEITEDFDPETLQLYYPSFLEEALLYKIASIIARGKTVRASEGEGYASNTWDTKYNQACQELSLLGLAEEFTSEEDLRFERKGFV